MLVLRIMLHSETRCLKLFHMSKYGWTTSRQDFQGWKLIPKSTVCPDIFSLRYSIVYVKCFSAEVHKVCTTSESPPVTCCHFSSQSFLNVAISCHSLIHLCLCLESIHRDSIYCLIIGRWSKLQGWVSTQASQPEHRLPFWVGMSKLPSYTHFWL